MPSASFQSVGKSTLAKPSRWSRPPQAAQRNPIRALRASREGKGKSAPAARQWHAETWRAPLFNSPEFAKRPEYDARAPATTIRGSSSSERANIRYSGARIPAYKLIVPPSRLQGFREVALAGGSSWRHLSLCRRDGVSTPCTSYLRDFELSGTLLRETGFYESS